MHRSTFITITLAFFVLAPCSHAQLTTVQLPTMQRFGMSTTVSVPDRGAVYLGGVNRSTYGSARRRTPLTPNTNRSFGSATAASGVSVSAYIHDFEEMDRQLIGDVAEPGAVSASQLDHSMPRVSDIRKRVQARKAAQIAVASRRIRAGVRYEKQGKLSAAKAKYRAAFAIAKPDWQKKIEQRLRKIDAEVAKQQSIASR